MNSSIHGQRSQNLNCRRRNHQLHSHRFCIELCRGHKLEQSRFRSIANKGIFQRKWCQRDSTLLHQHLNTPYRCNYCQCRQHMLGHRPCTLLILHLHMFLWDTRLRIALSLCLRSSYLNINCILLHFDKNRNLRDKPDNHYCLQNDIPVGRTYFGNSFHQQDYSLEGIEYKLYSLCMSCRKDHIFDKWAMTNLFKCLGGKVEVVRLGVMLDMTLKSLCRYTLIHTICNELHYNKLSRDSSKEHKNRLIHDNSFLKSSPLYRNRQ